MKSIDMYNTIYELRKRQIRFFAASGGFEKKIEALNDCKEIETIVMGWISKAEENGKVKSDNMSLIEQLFWATADMLKKQTRWRLGGKEYPYLIECRMAEGKVDALLRQISYDEKLEKPCLISEEDNSQLSMFS